MFLPFFFVNGNLIFFQFVKIFIVLLCLMLFLIFSKLANNSDKKWFFLGCADVFLVFLFEVFPILKSFFTPLLNDG